MLAQAPPLSAAYVLSRDATLAGSLAAVMAPIYLPAAALVLVRAPA